MTTSKSQHHDATIGLAELVGVPCHVTRVGVYQGPNMIPAGSLCCLMNTPHVGAPMCFIVGDKWLRTTAVRSSLVMLDADTVRLIVTTQDARYTLEFERDEVEATPVN